MTQVNKSADDKNQKSSSTGSTQPARTNEDKEYANTVFDSSSDKAQAEVGRPDAEYTIYGMTKRPENEKGLSEPEIRGIEPAPKKASDAPASAKK